MKRLLTAALLLACTPVWAVGAKQLSQHPTAYVDDGVCHIQGAVWDRKPMANISVAIVQVGTTTRHEVRTDWRVKFQLSVAVQSRTVFQALPDIPGSCPASRSEPFVVCAPGTVEVGTVERVD